VLNFNHLYYFHVAAAEGSIKGAAERLGVTQPTVSEQIKALERVLGASFFERSPSGLRLTEAGRQAFEHTTEMFQAGERLVVALGRSVDPPPLALRIGVSAAVSRTVAADFLMPALVVEDCRPIIRTRDYSDILRDLRAHELDLVIAEEEPLFAARRGLDCVTIHSPSLVAISGPDASPRADWQDLQMLEYRAASSYRWEIDAFLQERALRPTSVAELDDAFLMLEAVARGGFVAFVPKSVARDAIKSGRVKVLTTLQPTNASIYALYHTNDTSDQVRRTVERLAENARTHLDGA
jgi:LysR family transcriptional activator of nhaA